MHPAHQVHPRQSNSQFLEHFWGFGGGSGWFSSFTPSFEGIEQKGRQLFQEKVHPRQNPGYAYDRYEPALWDCSMEMMQFCVETYVSVCVTFLRSAKADYRRHTLNAFAKVAFSHPHHHRAPLITPSGCNYFTTRNSYTTAAAISQLYTVVRRLRFSSQRGLAFRSFNWQMSSADRTAYILFASTFSSTCTKRWNKTISSWNKPETKLFFFSFISVVRAAYSVSDGNAC